VARPFSRTANSTLRGELWGILLGRVPSGAGRNGRPSKEAVQQRRALLTFLVWGLLLGAAIGGILAVPLSSTAAITKGQPSPVNLTAPRTITYQSDVLTERARDTAANNPANAVYDTDETVERAQREAMVSTFENIGRIRENEALDQDDRIALITALPSLAITDTLALQIVQLDEDRWQLVVDESRRQYDQIWLSDPDGLQESEVTAKVRLLPYILPSTLNETERGLVATFVGGFLRPSKTLNEEATELQREVARASVTPVEVTVQRGEAVVREGQIVDDVIWERLIQLGMVFGAGGWLAAAQKFGLGMLTAWFYATYLQRFHNQLWRNPRGLAVIGATMAFTLLASRLMLPLVWAEVPYAFPLATLAVLLTVLFDARVGLLAALALAPLIGLHSDQPIALSITLALGSAAGVLIAQRAVRSIAFVYVGAGVALITALAAVCFWLVPLGETTRWYDIPLFSLLNGVQATVLTVGTYNLLGRLANTVTPLQLMELAHPNQPLLHRLMREAPGTYHHSMVVSNLAEMAAENIGADPLLARVGAYYHDIGKILRPYFFTDNQHERSNVHDVLDAKTSAAIIIDHVREGAKLAQQHGLPQQVIDFIPQHHGTNLVSYFYQRALQEDGDVDIDDFRYPGPKPQTCEAGIMMLADGVEATVRARSQSGKLRPVRPDDDQTRAAPGFQSIPEVVEQIVTERVRSGQLDECPLTLRDIAIIKESFAKTLQGIYHPRVDYPQPVAETAPQPTPVP